jgi:hypothetical protein
VSLQNGDVAIEQSLGWSHSGTIASL